jgi:replicative DNA helicase
VQSQYDFNTAFQDKIAALVIRDYSFYESTKGLILPEYFESQFNAVLVSIATAFYDSYRSALTPVGFVELIKERKKSGSIRKDTFQDIDNTYLRLLTTDISDRHLVIDRVVDFAKHRAMEKTIVESATYLQSGDFSKIEKSFKTALSIGAADNNGYDFFDEVDQRTQLREDVSSGKVAPTGITTGLAEIDQRLYHKGYGRGEASIYMGAAKSGKSTALIYAALAAVLSGHNVLYVTLEVSRQITVDRLDACLTSTLMNDLNMDAALVAQKIQSIKQSRNLGALKVHEFPSGSWSPADAHRLVESYKRSGLIFDEMIIDYLDIMRPNFRNEKDIENSRTIWIDCRALAQENNFALVSATQTNRDGFGADVATSIHVADDINKIRTADLVISINATDEEKRQGINRLYLTAGRNQEDGITIKVTTDRSRMTFITSVVSVT